MCPVICRVEQGHRPDAAKSLLQGMSKVHGIFRQSIDSSQPGNDNPFLLHIFDKYFLSGAEIIGKAFLHVNII
jgi:hypothetical protein